MTNSDIIRNLTDEEMVRVFCAKYCPTSFEPGFKCRIIGECKRCWEEWLKQGVSDGKVKEED